MAFEVNNSGINRVGDIHQKKKYQKPEVKEVQGENRDYSEAYSTLGASAMAQFQAAQNIQKVKTEPQETTEKQKIPELASFDEFWAFLKKGTSYNNERVNSLLINKGFTNEEIENLRNQIPQLNLYIEIMNNLPEVREDGAATNLKTQTKAVII